MYGVRSRPEFEAWLVRFADAGGHRFEWATQESLDGLVGGLPVRQMGVRVVQARGLRPLTHQVVSFELRPESGPRDAALAWRDLRERVARRAPVDARESHAEGGAARSASHDRTGRH
jgi:hypothetical protein